MSNKMYESTITTNPQQKLFSKSAKISHFSKPPLLPTPPNPAETSKPKTQTHVYLFVSTTGTVTIEIASNLH